MSGAIDFLASLVGEEIKEPLALPPEDHTHKLCREWWERHERVLEIERQGKGLRPPESTAQEARLEEAIQARYAILREIIANPPTTHSGAVAVADICAAMIEIDTQGKEPSYPWERGILAAVKNFRRP